MRTCRGLGLLALTLVTSRAHADVTHGDVPVVHGDVRGALGTLDPRASAASLATTARAKFGDGDTIVRFEQTHLGLPVIGRGATLRVDARDRARAAMLNLEDDLPANVTPAIGAARAAELARALTPLPTQSSDAHLVVAPTPDGAKLAWAVIPPMIPGLPTAPRFLIDAQTGALLEARDLVVFAQRASVYGTNPVTSTLAMRDLSIAVEDAQGFLSSPFVKSQNCIDNMTVKTVSFGLFQVPLHVCDLQQTAQANGSGDYVFAPVDDPMSPETRKDKFSEASMYFHASRVYTFFRALQGDPNAQISVDKPLRTISNLQTPPGLLTGDLQSAGDANKPLDPFQNAFFSPAGGSLGMVFQTLYGFDAGAMWFGQGPNRDYSYDGDVVYHELTHSMVDDTIKLGVWHTDSRGVIDAPGSMNEALADYFSSALAGDPNVGEYAVKDFDSSAVSIRTLDNKDTCLDTIVGEVHFDSTFFSGALWSVRASLAKPDQAAYDASLYKTLRMNPMKGDVGYEDLAKLFIDGLKSDLPAAATALEAEMGKRGVLPFCERIFPWQGKLMYPKKKRSPPYYAAPGTATLLGKPALAPGLFQIEVDFAEAASQVSVTFKEPVRAGALMFMNMGKPFTPKVLVKFDRPLTWTTKGKITSDADVTADCTGDGNKMLQTYSASFDVPPTATKAYVQIANAGDLDSTYGDIMLEVTPATPMDADAGADAGAPIAQPRAAGCSCDLARSSEPSGALSGLALGLALLLRRRRVC